MARLGRGTLRKGSLGTFGRGRLSRKVARTQPIQPAARSRRRGSRFGRLSRTPGTPIGITGIPQTRRRR